jgi:alkanesulfonate monooxygenase SsuD/methylene tetrahydromethanopterin reductase-like flavin-dependent oxidoreductase (luciferase family)
MYTPEKLSESLAAIAAMGQQCERSVPVKPGLFIFFAVHEDRDVAIKMAAERLSRQYNQDFSQLVHRYAIAGNPQDCRARLREYIDAGAATIILNSACPGHYTETNEAIMAEQVVTELKTGG